MTLAPSKDRERNPVTSSPYPILDDARDRPRERNREEPMPASLFYSAVYRKALHGHLETRVRGVAEASTEKPRWQKIIEHADSLVDELGMDREQFFANALIEYIGKLENQRFTEQLNESYEGVDQEQEVAFLNRLVDG